MKAEFDGKGGLVVSSETHTETVALQAWAAKAFLINAKVSSGPLGFIYDENSCFRGSMLTVAAEFTPPPTQSR
jgi:hypothetical protein